MRGSRQAPAQRQEGERPRGRGHGRGRGRGGGRGGGRGRGAARGARSESRESECAPVDTAGGDVEKASVSTPVDAGDKKCKSVVEGVEDKRKVSEQTESAESQAAAEPQKQASEKSGDGASKEVPEEERQRAVCERCLQRALVVCVDEECKSTVDEVMEAFVQSFALRFGLEESAVPVKILGSRRALVFLTTPMQGMSLVFMSHNRQHPYSPMVLSDESCFHVYFFHLNVSPARELYREKRRRPKVPSPNPYDVVLAADAPSDAAIGDAIAGWCKCAAFAKHPQPSSGRDMTVAKRLIAHHLGIRGPTPH